MPTKSLQLSKGEVQSLVKRAESLQNRVKKVKEQADNVLETGLRTLTVGGTAFGFGVMQGKFGGIEVLGVPAELIVGVGLHLAGFLGLGGKAAPIMHNVADGALAAWLTTLGRGVGKNWGGPRGGAVKGEALSDDDLASIARKQG